ncbi:MAG: hypothetical protein DWQ44_09770 [Bacteroidetes bacterium]|nr:MAG: hypothetical protein DWQ33_10045 [Bacteroidota bacterium]REK06571.1 MAG: hypothetical protein DWQ39_03560 [Bacteroidota bacterium]REK33337.1 MAG: hypothetical protein DWQ44_09770 [Bacteroidota bacterium]REK49737.1 MAG: hypothetical protein DWQ48_06325 [Bacteroidota bacterium]
MKFAISETGQKLQAHPKGRAFCANCKSVVIAKCGDFNIWHWAHESSIDCDSWNYEPKTDWHEKWQKLFGDDQSEISVQHGNECHRADILTNDGLAIEIQNSPISPADIYAREKFYDKMIWVINSKAFKHNLILKEYSSDTGKEIWFRWVRPYPPDSDLSFAVVIPDDDDNDQILQAVKQCEFTKAFDKEQNIHFWTIKKYTFQQSLPKEIFNAFTSYLLDKKLQHNLDDRISYKSKFRWLHLRKIWTTATKPKFIDLNNGYLFYIKTLHENGNGFGMIISQWRFLKKYRVEKTNNTNSN